MGTMQYKDCYATWDANGLTLGNELVKRTFYLSQARERPGPIRNPATGYRWHHGEGTPPEAYDRPGYDDITYEARVDDRSGLSEPHLCVTATLQRDGLQQRRCFTVYPGSPFISVQVAVRGLLQSPGTEARHLASNGVEVNKTPAGRTIHPDAIDLLPSNGSW